MNYKEIVSRKLMTDTLRSHLPEYPRGIMHSKGRELTDLVFSPLVKVFATCKNLSSSVSNHEGHVIIVNSLFIRIKRRELTSINTKVLDVTS